MLDETKLKRIVFDKGKLTNDLSTLELQSTVTEKMVNTLRKDLSRVKASFKSVPLQLYFRFPATLWHWLTKRFQNKLGEERFSTWVLPC